MAGFKFDGTNENIDLSSGGDVVDPQKIVTPPQNNETQVPNSSTSQTNVPPTRNNDTPASNPPQNRLPASNNVPSTQENVPQQKQSFPAKPATRIASRPTMQQRPQTQQPQQKPTSLPEQPSQQTNLPVRDYTNLEAEDNFVPPVIQTQPETQNFEQKPVRFSNPTPVSNNNYEEEPEEEYEEEPVTRRPKPVKKTAPKKTSTSRNNKKPTRGNKKDSSEKKVSKWSGGRRSVLIARIIAAIVLIIVVAVGFKTIFFPTQFPTAERVISVVKEGIGVTNFPTDIGEGFAVEFTKVYLTQTGVEDRDALLSEFVDSDVLAQMPLKLNSVDESLNTVDPEKADPNQIIVNQQATQTIVGDPILMGSESIDDNNAVFTTQSLLSTGTRIALSIPVYYDEKTNSMAVSAPVSILPTVGLADVPNDNHKISWSNDDAVVKEFEPDLTNYLKAWAASDTDTINRYVLPSGTTNSKVGLNNSVVFKQIDELKVEKLDSSNTSKLLREALVSVVWSDPRSPNITYQQSYLLSIGQTPDKKWNIKDITNVVVDKE